MKKNLLTILICIFFLDTYSNPIKIMDMIEIQKNGDIKYYMTEDFQIAHKPCASYYMQIQFDEYKYEFKDTVRIFRLNNKLFVKGIFKNGKKEGLFTYYYENGQIEMQGEYSSDLKSGIWRYFYKNGNAKKVIYHKGNYELLQYFADEDGKVNVVAGNGYYMGTAKISIANTHDFIMKGQVDNGLPSGEWGIYLAKFKIGTEYYQNGVFIKGISHSKTGDSEYSSNDRLVRFSDLDRLGRIKISGIAPYCNNNQYSASIDQQFKDRLKQEFNKSSIFCDTLINTWLLIELEYKNHDKISKIATYSNIDNESISKIEALIYSLKNIELNFKKSPNGKVFFPMVLINSELYLYGDSNVDLLRSFL